MKTPWRFAALALLLSSASALQAQQFSDPAAVPRMTIEAFKAALEKGQVVVIDVRGDAVYASGHIPTALSVSGAALDQKAAEWKASQQAAEQAKQPLPALVTYCS